MFDILKISGNNLPKWFNIWRIVNVCTAIVFFIYWYSIEFESNFFTTLFFLYGNLWGLWAAKYRKNQKDIETNFNQ